MLKLLKQFLFGRPETEEERRIRKKAKIYMLGAGAGAAMKADDDGIVRIHKIHADKAVDADNADDDDRA